jgi:hypothetical protein
MENMASIIYRLFNGKYGSNNIKIIIVRYVSTGKLFTRPVPVYQVVTPGDGQAGIVMGIIYWCGPFF